MVNGCYATVRTYQRVLSQNPSRNPDTVGCVYKPSAWELEQADPWSLLIGQQHSLLCEPQASERPYLITQGESYLRNDSQGCSPPSRAVYTAVTCPATEGIAYHSDFYGFPTCFPNLAKDISGWLLQIA